MKLNEIQQLNHGIVMQAGQSLFGPDARTLDGGRFFASALLRTLAESAANAGIDFSGYTPEQQAVCALKFLRELHNLGQRRLDLSRHPEEQLPEGTVEITVNQALSDAVFVNPDGSESQMRFGADRKNMLGYFLGATIAKIDRYLDPRISAKKLSLLTAGDYTVDQLREHLLMPLDKIGVLDVLSGKGYKLNCKPSDIARFLKAEATPQIPIVGTEAAFEDIDNILIEEYLLSLLSIIADSTDEVNIFNSKIVAKELGLSSDSVCAQMKKLAESHLVARTGELFYRRDFNLPYIQHIVAAQSPIKIVLNKVGMPKQKTILRSIDRNRVPMRHVEKQEKPTFPQLPWSESAETEQVEEASDILFGNIYDVLHARIDSGPAKSVAVNGFYVLVPQPSGISEQKILGILDLLGIGPHELRGISYAAFTIASGIKNCEANPKNTLQQTLIAEIKARLASIIYGDVVNAEQGKSFHIEDLIADLADLANMPLINSERDNENSDEKQEVEDFPQNTEDKCQRAELNVKLLAEMRGPYNRQLEFVLSHDTLPTKEMMPVQIYNFYRMLTGKAELIPWRQLIGLGLAKESGRDHHPLLSQPGAFATMFFLNSDLRAQIIGASHGKSSGLKTTLLHMSHLLSESLQSVGLQSSQDKIKYLKHCLKEIPYALTCACASCSEAKQIVSE